MIARKKTNPRQKSETTLEYLSRRATRWVGSVESLVFHTAVFAGAFIFCVFGFSFTNVLLVVTTIVSLEAIYLSIFAQMTLNKHTDELEDIQEDVGDIQENVEEIQVDVDEIQEDVDEIQEDVEEIQEDVDEIQEGVGEIQENVEELQEEDETDLTPAEKKRDHDTIAVDTAMLGRIEFALKELGKEISEMKRRSTK